MIYEQKHIFIFPMHSLLTYQLIWLFYKWNRSVSLHNTYVSYNSISFGIVICIHELLAIFWTYKCHSYRWHSIFVFMIKDFPYWINTFDFWSYPSLLYISKNTWGSYLTIWHISVNPSMRLYKKGKSLI